MLDNSHDNEIGESVIIHVNIPSFSMIWAVAVLSTNCAKVPPMVITPVRSKVSVSSTLLSSVTVI